MNIYRKMFSFALVLMLIIQTVPVKASSLSQKLVLEALEKTQEKLDKEQSVIRAAIAPEGFIEQIGHQPNQLDMTMQIPASTISPYYFDAAMLKIDALVASDQKQAKQLGKLAFALLSQETELKLDLNYFLSNDEIAIAIPQLLGDKYLSVSQSDLDSGQYNEITDYFEFFGLYTFLSQLHPPIDKISLAEAQALLARYRDFFVDTIKSLPENCFKYPQQTRITASTGELAAETIEVHMSAEQVDRMLLELAQIIRTDQTLNKLLAVNGMPGDMAGLLADNLQWFPDMDLVYTATIANGLILQRSIQIDTDDTRTTLFCQTSGNRNLLDETVIQIDSAQLNNLEDTSGYRLAIGGNVVPVSGTFDADLTLERFGTVYDDYTLDMHYSWATQVGQDNLKYRLTWEPLLSPKLQQVREEEYEEYLTEFNEYVEKVKANGIDAEYEAYLEDRYMSEEDIEEEYRVYLENYDYYHIPYDSFEEYLADYSDEALTFDEYEAEYFMDGWDQPKSLDEFLEPYEEDYYDYDYDFVQFLQEFYYDEYLPAFAESVEEAKANGTLYAYEQYLENLPTEEELLNHYEYLVTLSLYEPESYEEFRYYYILTREEYEEYYFSDGWDEPITFDEMDIFYYGYYSSDRKFEIEGKGTFNFAQEDAWIKLNLNQEVRSGGKRYPITMRISVSEADAAQIDLAPEQKIPVLKLSDEEMEALLEQIEKNMIQFYDELYSFDY